MLQWIRRHFIFCDPISACNASQSLLVACGMKGHSQTLLVVTQGRYHLPLWPLMNKLESQDSINWYQSSCCSASPCGTARGLHCSWTWMATAFRNSCGNFVLFFLSSFKSTKLTTCLPAKTFFKISNPLSVIGNAVRKKIHKIKAIKQDRQFQNSAGLFNFLPHRTDQSRGLSHCGFNNIRTGFMFFHGSFNFQTRALGMWRETLSPVLFCFFSFFKEVRGGTKGKVGHSFIFELSHEKFTANGRNYRHLLFNTPWSCK